MQEKPNNFKKWLKRNFPGTSCRVTLKAIFNEPASIFSQPGQSVKKIIYVSSKK